MESLQKEASALRRVSLAFKLFVQRSSTMTAGVIGNVGEVGVALSTLVGCSR